MAASSIAAAFWQIPAGLLVDSLRFKRLLVAVSGLLVAAGCLLVAFHPQFAAVVPRSDARCSLRSHPASACGAQSWPRWPQAPRSRIQRSESFNHGGNFRRRGKWRDRWVIPSVMTDLLSGLLLRVASAAVVNLINPAELIMTGAWRRRARCDGQFKRRSAS